MRRGDVDPYGPYSSADLKLALAVAQYAPSQAVAGYLADGDLNLDGDIEADDVALLNNMYEGAAPKGDLWTALTGTAHPTPGDPLSAWCAAPTVGYVGAVYSRAAGLLLMRNRWYDPPSAADSSATSPPTSTARASRGT